MKNVAIVFSKDPNHLDPLEHIVSKRPVYEEFMQLGNQSGFHMIITTRHAYKGNGIFSSYWDVDTNNKIHLQKKEVRVDLAYDRTGGLAFPLEQDSMIVVNTLEFKKISWDKWLMYEELETYMPKTFYVGEIENLIKVIDKVKSSLVVVKPIGGLGGRDIYIGPKDSALSFIPEKQNQLFIIQEFVETSGGINKITEGRHDLRVVCINNKIIWSHIRIPKIDSYLSNVKHGGELTEIDPSKLPEKILNTSREISKNFYKKYDNPLFSIDFGVDGKGNAVVFEINDQIGFPKTDMQNKNMFLDELIKNFKNKLSNT